jgi:hypothetical protein
MRMLLLGDRYAARSMCVVRERGEKRLPLFCALGAHKKT